MAILFLCTGFIKNSSKLFWFSVLSLFIAIGSFYYFAFSSFQRSLLVYYSFDRQPLLQLSCLWQTQSNHEAYFSLYQKSPVSLIAYPAGIYSVFFYEFQQWKL